MRKYWWIGIWLWGCSAPPEVVVVPVRRADLVESFREEAETRFRHTHVVSMPAAGRIARIELEPGDEVRQGQILARFDRLPGEIEVAEREAEVQQILEELSLAGDVSVESAEVSQNQALLREAQERLPEVRALLDRARAELNQQQRELSRSRRLLEQGALPPRDLEQAELAYRQAQSGVDQAASRLRSQQALVEAGQRSLEGSRQQVTRRLHQQQVVEARLQQAQQRLQRARHESQQQRLVSPISGVVVERFQTGPGVLPAGEKLLSLARPQDLEAVSEVLTQDALRLKPGLPVRWTAGPGQAHYQARVSRMEPRGFTKLSSLGVEQKRVRVFLELKTRPPGLGADYRLDAEFLLGSHPGALTIPRSSLLQKPDGSFFVFGVEAGTLRPIPVKIGNVEDLRVEVAEGLSEGQEVVVSPDSTTVAGLQVRQVLAESK